MELGQRLKQARLEAGLSQRQLCGDEITRNMLSQIENGNARPSMDTLRYLAARLRKPMGYFLEEQAITSPNQAVMEQARNAMPEKALELLNAYRGPDPVFDRERWLLEALSCMALAEAAILDDRTGYAATLLEQAAAAGDHTPYYTAELERRRLLLCHRVKALPAKDLADALPDCTEELLLRAEGKLQQGDPAGCGRLLDAVENRSEHWHFLRAEAYLAQKEFSSAAEHYLLAGSSNPVYAKLELCYRELEDYKKAYEYACKQR